MIREISNFMSSLWGDVVKVLIDMGFDRDDVLKYTTIGTLSQLHKFDVADIKKIVKREINEYKHKKSIA